MAEQRDKRPSRRPVSRRMTDTVVKWLFSIGALLLLGARTIRPEVLPDDAITLALIVAAIIPWMSSFVSTAELPGGWKVEFRKLETEQQQQRHEIETLRFLITHFITDFELQHLTQLATGDAFRYDKNDRFVTELRRLRELGFIRMKPPEIALRDLPSTGDLRTFIEITDRGREYLALRDPTPT